MIRAATRPRSRGWAVAVAALLLAGCASTPREARFYREDGPPERVPSDLLATPDAVPRDEPLNPYANRPYVALGRTYVPETSRAPFHQRGIASWYGRQFQGNRTASGERYDMFAMTAAHPTLPIPSYARVTSVRDGRSVIVRINDRGPFLHDRIIDLSYVAAARLGLAGSGSGEVEIDRVWNSLLPPAGEGPGVRAASSLPPAREGPGVGATSPLPLAGEGPGVRAASPAPPAGEGAGAMGASPLPLAGEGPGVRAAMRWSVQLGAFAIATNAEALRDRLALLLASPEASALPAELRAPRIERTAGLNRVLIGDATQRAVALQWSQLLEQYLARPTTLFAR